MGVNGEGGIDSSVDMDCIDAFTSMDMRAEVSMCGSRVIDDCVDSPVVGCIAGCNDMAGCIVSGMVYCIASCIAGCIDSGCIDSGVAGGMAACVDGFTAPETNAKAAEGDNIGGGVRAIWASTDVIEGCESAIIGAVGAMLSACIVSVVAAGGRERRGCTGSSQTEGCAALVGGAVIAACS